MLTLVLGIYSTFFVQYEYIYCLSINTIFIKSYKGSTVLTLLMIIT